MKTEVLDASPYPRPLRAWWTVAVLFFALLVSFTDRLIISALVDPMRAELKISDSAVGVLQGAAFAVAYACAGLALGRAADRRRRLTIILIGTTTWCAATVACGLVTSYWQLVLARIMVGIGEAALAPAALSIVADSFPPARRGTATSVFFLGSFLGSPLSIVVGGVMLGLAQRETFSTVHWLGDLPPWRIVMVVVGLVGLLVPVLLLTLKEPRRRDHRDAEPFGVMIRHFAKDWRMLAPLYLAIGVTSLGDYGMFAWTPTLLTRRFAMSPELVGQWFGVVTATAGVVGCLLAGPLSDLVARRVGVRGRLVVPLIAALAASAAALLFAATHVAVVFVGLALWTVLGAIGSISSIAALQAVIPTRYNGVGAALLAFCTVIFGLGLGPVFVPLITEQVFRDPLSVGFAITTVATSAAILGAGLLFVSSRATAILAARAD